MKPQCCQGMELKQPLAKNDGTICSFNKIAGPKKPPSIQNGLHLSLPPLHWMPCPNNLTAFIDQKSRWNGRYSKLLVDRSRRINRHVVIHWDLLLKFLHGSLVLIRDSNDLQSLGLIFGVDLVEVRNAFPAGWAPCCPKLHEERFASEFRLFAQIIQGERGK